MLTQVNGRTLKQASVFSLNVSFVFSFFFFPHWNLQDFVNNFFFWFCSFFCWMERKSPWKKDSNEWSLINLFPHSSPPDVLLNYEFDAELENSQKNEKNCQNDLTVGRRSEHVLLFLIFKKTYKKISCKFSSQINSWDMNEFCVIRVLGKRVFVWVKRKQLLIISGENTHLVLLSLKPTLFLNRNNNDYSQKTHARILSDKGLHALLHFLRFFYCTYIIG